MPIQARDHIVGRRTELAVLDAAFADLALGRGGSVRVEGEAGIGKSALVDAAVMRRDTAAVDVLRGECDELGQRFPLSVVLSAFGISEHAVDPLRAETAAALNAAGGVSPVSSRADGVMASLERLAAFVDRLCARRPVALVLEDQQWADEASLKLWARLGEAVAQLPLLLIGVRRTTQPSGEIEVAAEPPAQAGHETVLRLGPLSSDEVLEYAGRILTGRPGERLAERLSSAGGNPLFVRELIDGLRRSGGLAAGASGVELAGDAPEAIHWAPTLAQSVAERIELLGPRSRDLLQIASLLGVEFGHDELAALVDAHTAQLTPALGEALDAGVVESLGSGRMRFRHGVIRETLYALMPEALRVAVYRDLAQYLIRRAAPVERTAEAVLRALDAADGWELDWLAAHTNSLLYRAPAIAVQLLGHAVDAAPLHDPRRGQFEDGHMVALLEANLFLEAEQSAQRIFAESGDAARRGRAAMVRVQVCIRTNRREEALRAYEQTVAEPLPPVWRARLLAIQSGTLTQLGRYDEASRAAEEAAASGESLGDGEAAGRALNCLGVVTVLAGADGDRRVGLFERALEAVGDDASLAELRALVLANLMGQYDAYDRYERLEELQRRARTLPDEIGEIRASKLWIQAGMCAFNRGRWDDALTELASAAAVPEAAAQARVLYHSHALMIAVHRDDEEAIRRHDRALQAFDESEFWRIYQEPILEARALVAERAGQREATLDLLRPLVEPEYPHARGLRINRLPDLARAALALEPAGVARRTAAAAAAAAEADAKENATALNLAFRDWCDGLARDRIDALTAAAAYFRGAHRLLRLGNVLEDTAYVHATRGGVDAARSLLVEATSVYAELGANWDSRRATARLRSFGVRLGVRGSRQRASTGWDALSTTEARIAELVASGLSNPDIAARLVLSRRTVQTHVSHILRKLGVSSRRAIADLAVRRASEPVQFDSTGSSGQEMQSDTL